MSTHDHTPNANCAAGLKHALLLTRPYSWVDAALNVVVGVVLVRGHRPTPDLFWAVAVGLALWFTLNWMSERIQRDPGRTPVSWPVALAPFLLASAVVYRTAEAASIIPLAAFLLLSFLYPWKARRPAIGPFGPVIRGLQTASIAGVGLAMGGEQLLTWWPLLAALALSQASRSLTGDLRDVESDDYELPQIIGVERTKQIVLASLVASLVLFHRVDMLWAVLPFMGLQLLATLVAPLRFSYELHLLFVITSVGAKLGIVLMSVDLGIGWVVLIALVQLFLLLSYVMVPRPSNEAFHARMNRGWRTPE